MKVKGKKQHVIWQTQVHSCKRHIFKKNREICIVFSKEKHALVADM